MVLKQLDNFTKDLLEDSLIKYKEFMTLKVAKKDFESDALKYMYVNELNSAEILLKILGESNSIELDIHSKMIKRAICSATYHNGANVANFGNQNQAFQKEMFEKQKRYLDAFNEIFGYSGMEEFQKAMVEVSPNRL
ncbi:MAG: hypothetical protein ACW9W4_05750 [Candidatus Nitrosopumilus sp. bin_7KS]